MFTLPDWAPHVHPLIVHFPIAILFLAAFVDFLSLILSRQVWLGWATLGLYGLGALSALGAFYTGRDAAETLYLSASANSVLTDHANLAEWTVWFYGIYALARLAVEWKKVGHLRPVRMFLFVVGAAGLLLVKETGEHGAQMVYQYGVGVASPGIVQEESEAHTMHSGSSAHHDDHGAAKEDTVHAHSPQGSTAGHEHMLRETGPEIVTTSKGWRWDVGRNGVDEFKRAFEVLAGDWSDILISVATEAGQGNVLNLEVNEKQVFLTSGPSIVGVQFDGRLNMDAFNGAIRLVHHVQDANNYNFMEVNNTQVMLGRIVDGKMRIEDEGKYPERGWLDLRVVGDGTHFRGYINKKMVVHGHGKKPDSGPVGLYVQGKGIIKLDGFDVQKLR